MNVGVWHVILKHEAIHLPLVNLLSIAIHENTFRANEIRGHVHEASMVIEWFHRVALIDMSIVQGSLCCFERGEEIGELGILREVEQVSVGRLRWRRTVAVELRKTNTINETQIIWDGVSNSAISNDTSWRLPTSERLMVHVIM